jgi:hypothetical protein
MIMMIKAQTRPNVIMRLMADTPVDETLQKVMLTIYMV